MSEHRKPILQNQTGTRSCPYRPSTPELTPVLEPLGNDAGDFFLAASLYHAHKVSFGAAAALAGLGYEEFHYRLKEHFGSGFAIDDETVREDLRLADDIAEQRP